jgi:hypothetical protein
MVPPQDGPVQEGISQNRERLRRGVTHFFFESGLRPLPPAVISAAMTFLLTLLLTIIEKSFINKCTAKAFALQFADARAA